MTVYLVGAGPGDPGLLTVRGRDLLAQADVVLYDALVDPRLLALVPAGALLMDVGKRSGGATSATSATDTTSGAAHCEPGVRHSTSQAAINELLIAHGRTGRCVVRLKGGDPFVFGRGGEEALALVEAGIPFEVVPGVSSAIAVPAYAGIPVTHRGLAASLLVVTGHETVEKGPAAAGVDWAKVATAADTLVILMGVSRLPEIASQLMAHGRSPQTPAAVIEEGTTARQRVVTGTLEDLPALAAATQIRSPAAIVVGEVVRVRERLAWFTTHTPASTPAQADGQGATHAHEALLPGLT